MSIELVILVKYLHFCVFSFLVRYWNSEGTVRDRQWPQGHFPDSLFMIGCHKVRMNLTFIF